MNQKQLALMPSSKVIRCGVMFVDMTSDELYPIKFYTNIKEEDIPDVFRQWLETKPDAPEARALVNWINKTYNSQGIIAHLDQGADGELQKAMICPHCQSKMNRHSATNNGRHPQEGDVVCCYHCSNLSVIRENNTLMKPTEEQLKFYQDNLPEWQRFMRTKKVVETARSKIN